MYIINLVFFFGKDREKKNDSAHCVRRKVDPCGPTNRFLYGLCTVEES